MKLLDKRNLPYVLIVTVIVTALLMWLTWPKSKPSEEELLNNHPYVQAATTVDERIRRKALLRRNSEVLMNWADRLEKKGVTP